MNYIKIAAIFFCSSLFLSCIKTEDEINAYDYAVSCLLINLRPYQVLVVSKSLDENRLAYLALPLSGNLWKNKIFTENVIVKDARPFIITPLDTAEFVYGLRDSAFYSENSTLTIAPLTEYKLTVNFSNGHVATGKTITPGNFEILYPLNNQVIKADTSFLKIHIERRSANQIDTFITVFYKVSIRLRWTESPNSYMYCVNSTYDNMPRLTNSNEYNLFFEIPDDDIYKYKKIDIAIFAFDKNISYYLKKQIIHAGVEGAYGVFGSSIGKIISVKIEYN